MLLPRINITTPELFGSDMPDLKFPGVEVCLELYSTPSVTLWTLEINFAVVIAIAAVAGMLGRFLKL